MRLFHRNKHQYSEESYETEYNQDLSEHYTFEQDLDEKYQDSQEDSEYDDSSYDDQSDYSSYHDSDNSDPYGYQPSSAEESSNSRFQNLLNKSKKPADPDAQRDKERKKLHAKKSKPKKISKDEQKRLKISEEKERVKASATTTLESLKKVDLSQPYRMQAAHARVATLVAALFAATTVALAGVIMMMLPLRRDVPFLIYGGDPSLQVWRIEQFRTNAAASDVLAESFAADYVLKRETIDLVTERTRYADLRSKSSNDVFKDFQASIQSKTGPYVDALNSNITRDVKINSIVTLVKGRQIQIRFDLIYQHNQSIVKREAMIATLSYRYSPPRFVRRNERYENPTGWIVTNYDSRLEIGATN